MDRRVILGLVAGFVLAGCGEQAAKGDMIDAPTVSSGQVDSAKARGISPEEVARQKAQEAAGPGGNRK